MSVVAWDGKTLAADKQGTNAGYAFTVTKMRRIKRGVVVAWTGTFEYGMLLAEWYAGGAKPEEWPAFQRTDGWTRLIVVEKGKAFVFEQEPVKQPVETPFDAWGCGRDYALGALAMGAGAAEAVLVASRFSTGCGLGVDSQEVA